MVNQLIGFNSGDFVKWEAEFEANEEDMLKMGLIERHVFCSEDSQEEIFVLLKWDNMKSALGYLGASGLRFTDDEGMHVEEIETFIKEAHLFEISMPGIRALEAGELKFSRGERLSIAKGAGLNHMRGAGFKAAKGEFTFAKDGINSDEGVQYTLAGLTALRGEGLLHSKGELKMSDERAFLNYQSEGRLSADRLSADRMSADRLSAKESEGRLSADRLSADRLSAKESEDRLSMRGGLTEMSSSERLNYKKEMESARGEGYALSKDEAGLFSANLQFSRNFNFSRASGSNFTARGVGYFS